MPEDRETADKQTQSQHARPTIPFSYQAPTDKTNYSTKRNWNSCREWVRLLVEFLALLFLIWYADSASIQATANQNAADAAATAAHVAADQAASLKKQLDDFENAQAAKLVIDIELSHKIDGKYFACDGTAAVKNVGPTVARDINWSISGGDGVSTNPPKPNPADTGIALGSGDSLKRPIPLTCSGAPADQVLSHQYIVSWTIDVSYRDIFNRPQAISACRWWDQDADDFEACVDYDPSYRKIPK